MLVGEVYPISMTRNKAHCPANSTMAFFRAANPSSFLAFCSLFANWLLLCSLMRTCQAHITVGLQGHMPGENPTGDPTLPAISGAFEVELKVRFNEDKTGLFHNLFEYSTTVNDADSIWFGQFTSSGLNTAFLQVNVSGIRYFCFHNNPGITSGRIYTYKFGVDATNTASIFQDGTLRKTCPGIPVPANVSRNHFLGRGDFDNLVNVESLRGAILGLRVTNLGTTLPQAPGEAFALRNFPGQTFSSSFVASFYARFDNISSGRNYQRVFDFGNGLADDNIWCSQYKQSSDFACAVFRDSVGYRVVAPNAIVEGEFAFWHFGADINGPSSTLWIEKDGVRVAEVQFDIQLNNVFRESMLVGASNWPNTDDDLAGVVLGLRLDRAIAS